jgi:hypothetical protein
MTAASVPIPSQIQGMMLLATISQKWDMLATICLMSLEDITNLDFNDAHDQIIVWYETEQVCEGKGGQQHANKLSTVKQKHSNQHFSN